MKVYVVKNDKGEYMTETGDFIKSLWQAELFYDYDCAYCHAPSGCNIVECSLMEKYQLADHEKQVRKEVVQDIKEEVLYYTSSVMCENCGCIQPENYIKHDGLMEILDQIQGE